MSRWITIETAELAVKALEEENAHLKAEIERLRLFTTRTIIPNEQLQAQVERLTKAGDAMAEHALLAHWGSFEYLPIGWKKLIPEWNAAKGVQS